MDKRRIQTLLGSTVIVLLLGMLAGYFIIGRIENPAYKVATAIGVGILVLIPYVSYNFKKMKQYDEEEMDQIEKDNRLS